MTKISKLVFSNIYERYFPVTRLSMQQINDKDLKQISFWLKGVYKHIEKVNLNELCRAEIKSRNGKNVKYRILKWSGDNPMIIGDKLNKRKFDELTDRDIAALNTVIHLHKYKIFISTFVFPIRKSSYGDLI